MQRKIDSPTLEMALVGYTAELQKIEEKIIAIRKHLREGAKIPVAAPAVSHGSGPKRRLSSAARKRIAAAQKKRWREFHAKQKAATGAARKVVPKRSFSPAAKAKLVANLVKARAAKAAKEASA